MNLIVDDQRVVKRVRFARLNGAGASASGTLIIRRDMIDALGWEIGGSPTRKAIRIELRIDERALVLTEIDTDEHGLVYLNQRFVSKGDKVPA